MTGVPTVYAEVMSGGPSALRVRAFLDADDAELFGQLLAASDGVIETAYWMKATGDTATGQALTRLHCRCDSAPFDLAFHFEANDPVGRLQVAGLRDGVRSSALVVEAVFDGAPDGHPISIELVCDRVEGTADLVSRLHWMR